jgi:hypothetical protein
MRVSDPWPRALSSRHSFFDLIDTLGVSLSVKRLAGACNLLQWQ